VPISWIRDPVFPLAFASTSMFNNLSDLSGLKVKGAFHRNNHKNKAIWQEIRGIAEKEENTMV
jgi:hypothetical protein